MTERSVLRDASRAGVGGDRPAGSGTACQPGRVSGQRGPWPGLLRSAAAPVLAAAVIITLLFTWTVTGGAGTLRPVRITVGLAAIPVPLIQQPGTRMPDATTYLVIHSRGGRDELLGARSPEASSVVFVRDGRRPFAHAGRLSGIAIPAAGVDLSPFGVDVVLLHPPALRSGEIVPIMLRFRNAGTVLVDLQVTNSLADPH
jgi:copper(I)-binding protein